jgi:hypothetical protein
MAYLIGRYERVRIFWPHYKAVSAPYIIDKKNETLSPSGDKHWWKSPEGLWIPHVSGGVGNNYSGGFGSGIDFLPTELDGTAISKSSTILDSAYVAGTSGDAIGFRFPMVEAKTLTDVYFDVNSYLGTAANVNDIDIEIRAHDSVNNFPDVSGAALASGSVDPASLTDRWQNVGSLSVSLSAGSVYWYIVADLDGNSTDRANVSRILVPDNSTIETAYVRCMAATTTNGWSSQISRQVDAPACVISFSDGTSIGFPFLILTAAPSDTNQKGLLLNSGFSGNARIYGSVLSDRDNDLSSLKIWEGSSGPSGTPFAETSTFVRATQTGGNTKGGFLFTGSSFPLLTKGITYRIVFQPTGVAVDAPDQYDTGPVSDANIRAAFPGGGDWYWTAESGGSWVDDQDLFPVMGLLIDDFDPDSAEGGDATGRVFPIFPA